VGAFNEPAFLRYEQSPDNVLRSGLSKGEGGRHVAQKPVKLLRALIELATLAGHVVLDPFCGSGSTLVAAKSVGRQYLGFEIDRDAARICEERLTPDLFEVAANHQGKRA
jgi:site-specific DNA-methyltransferase (adenine-specific)